MKVSKFAREPLIHFLALGALLFVLHTFVNNSRAPEKDNRIVISDTKVEWLQSMWSKKWQRTPTEQELKGLIENYVREEILYREALTIGLDENDTIIRRRLAQKMEFLAKDIGQMIKPTEDEIKNFFNTNIELYREPELISFSHVYFNQDHRANADMDSRTVLTSLREKAISPEAALSSGDRFMLHYDYPQKSHVEIMKLFGMQFADTIFKISDGSWQGPVKSGYGLHLVYITERMEASLPDFDEVKQEVHNDFIDQSRKQSYEKYYHKLREKYDIEITASTL